MTVGEPGADGGAAASSVRAGGAGRGAGPRRRALGRRGHGTDVVLSSSTDRAYLQGRTAAGGWSQQRFARRRDNQRTASYESAAATAARMLVPSAASLRGLVLGGDRRGWPRCSPIPGWPCWRDLPRPGVPGHPRAAPGRAGRDRDPQPVGRDHHPGAIDARPDAPRVTSTSAESGVTAADRRPQRPDRTDRSATASPTNCPPPAWQVDAAVALLDGGATVPFIARYRKEATGSLDDAQLRLLTERLDYLRELEDRRAAILESIAAQGKLTDALAAQIAAADTKARLEDIYLPFKTEAADQGADRPGGGPGAAGRPADRRIRSQDPTAAAAGFVDAEPRDRGRRRRHWPAPGRSSPSGSARTRIWSASCGSCCGQRGRLTSTVAGRAGARTPRSSPTTSTSPSH